MMLSLHPQLSYIEEEIHISLDKMWFLIASPYPQKLFSFRNKPFSETVVQVRFGSHWEG